MKRVFRSIVAGCVMASSFCGVAGAEGLDKAMQDKLDAKVKVIQTWAADPAIVSAVKAHNAKLADDEAAMTQEKWKGLSVLDPFVRSYNKNPAGQFLKARKDGSVAEAFVSGADGKKVAFLAKTSGWSHAGKEKHVVPMKGETWQGGIEVDESTGTQQVQVGVPVVDGGKPIGSLVVGVNVAKLKE